MPNLSQIGIRRRLIPPRCRRLRPDVAHYGYRWYDPATGRWPSRDRIGEEGGNNLYAFIDNDGVNQFDVLGKQAYTVGGGINDAKTGEMITGYTPTEEQVRQGEIAAAAAAFAVVGGAALTETEAMVAAGAAVARLTKTIKCIRCKKPSIGKANHPFYIPKPIKTPPYFKVRRCFMKHVEIKCWIKGKKGATLSIQVPFGTCWKNAHGEGGITH